MTRRVFFSFHYQRDIWRVNTVRNSWIVRPEGKSANFWDQSLWEEAKLKGDEAIKELIDKGLKNSSVTAVLIGAQTFGRKFVEYEIIESYKRGNGMLGIYIYNLKDQVGNVDIKGRNPFDNIYISQPDGSKQYFSAIYPTYDYKMEDGYNNLGQWVENAAKVAGH